MTHKRKKIIGALLLTLGTLAAAVIWQFEKPGSLVWDNGFKYQTDKRMSVRTYKHDLPTDESKIKSLEIEVKNADVEFVKGDKFGVTSYILSGKNDTKVSFNDGRLSVTDNGDGDGTASLGFGVVYRSNKIIITIPEAEQLSTIVAKSTNGDFDFENIVIKNATLTATNGDIKFERSEVDNLTVTNQNGEIALKQTIITIGGKITNQNGDIEIKKSRLPEFYAETKWGEKDIKKNHDMNQSDQSQAKLIIMSQNGDVEIE